MYKWWYCFGENFPLETILRNMNIENLRLLERVPEELNPLAMNIGVVKSSRYENQRQQCGSQFKCPKMVNIFTLGGLYNSVSK